MSLESLPSNISEHLSQINSQTHVNDFIQTPSCDQEVECNLPLSIKPEKYFTQKTVKSNNKGLDVKRQAFFRNKAELFLSDNEISDTLVPPKVHAPHHTLQRKSFHFIQNLGDQDTQNHLIDQKEHNYDYHNFLLNRMEHLSIDLPLQSSIESEETIAEPVRMIQTQTQKNAVIKRESANSHQRTMSYKDNFNRSKERKLQVFKAKGSPHSEHIFIDNPHIEIDLSSQVNNNYQPCGDRSENMPTFATYSSVEEEFHLKTSHDSFPLSNLHAKENNIQVQGSHDSNSLDQSDKENKNFNLNARKKEFNNSKKTAKKNVKSKPKTSTYIQQEPHYLNPIAPKKKKNQEEQSFQSPCLEKAQSLLQTDEKLKEVTPAKETNDRLPSNPKQVTIDFSHPSPFSPINILSEKKVEVSPKTIPLLNVKDCPKIYGPQPKRLESDCVIENACILGNIIQSNKAIMDYPKVTIKLSDNNDDTDPLVAAAQSQSAKNSQKIRDLLTKRNEHILRKIIGKANIDYPFPVYNPQHSQNLSVELIDNHAQPKEAQFKGETINVSHLSERCISEPNGFYIKKGGAEVESDYITKSFDDHRCIEPKSKSFIKIENNAHPQFLRRNQSDPKIGQSTASQSTKPAATKKNSVRTLSLDISSKFKNNNIEKQLNELPNHPIIKRTSISKIPHKNLEKSFEKSRTSNILPDKRLSLKKENNPLSHNLNRITKQFQTYTILDVPKPKKDLNNQSQLVNIGFRRESCNLIQEKYKNKSSLGPKPPAKHKRSATINEFNKSFR